MKKYSVQISYDEIIVNADDENNAESQAISLIDFGNADIEVEELTK